jgi:serine/threonine-protein kinase
MQPRPENELNANASPTDDPKPATGKTEIPVGETKLTGSGPAPEPSHIEPAKALDDSKDAVKPRDKTVIYNKPAQPAEGPAGRPKTKIKVDQLGEFKLVKKLGEGGMGAVYLATQVGLDRNVAIKVLARHLADNANFIQRFQREARMMAKLDHPHILSCFTVGEDKGYHYLAMEYAEGGTLAGQIRKFGKLSVGDALHVIIASAHALQHAHELNLIHRDIKPENILITGKGIVKVADLGLAKAITDDLSLTRTGMGTGTPAYMSPEQTRDSKHVDCRSDIYALGCTLYCCLTGKPPFKGETYIEMLEEKEKERFTPASRLHEEAPARLDMIIAKTLSKDAKARYATCADLIRALSDLEMSNARLSYFPATTASSGVMRTLTYAPSAKPAPTVALPAAQKEEFGYWYVRCLNFDGTRKMNRRQIEELIRQDNFDVKAEASRTPNGQFWPLGSIPEFDKPFRGHIAKAKANIRSATYSTKFQEIVAEQDRYQRRRKLNNLLRRIGGWILLTIVLSCLAVGAYYGYKAIHPRISRMLQSSDE